MIDGDKRPVLDHGYVQLIETWGSDERIIEAARMSTAKGFQGWGPKPCEEPMPAGSVMHDPQCSKCQGSNRVAGDEKLLRYLWEHRHHTPFEMAGMTIEVQAPLFVFREWHRHRTQSYNEMSARYTQMPDLHYVPSVERILQGGQDAKNRQGSADLTISYARAESIRTQIAVLQTELYAQYEQLLALGLSKELARINTPVSRYSRMRASANLRNWLGFLTLRTAPAAQWEIRQFADSVEAIVSEAFPRTSGLFREGRS